MGTVPRPLVCGVKKRAATEEKTICAVKLWTGGMSRRPSKPGTLELYQPMGNVMGVAPRTEKSKALCVYFHV